MNIQTKIIPGHKHPDAIVHPQAHLMIGCTVGARTRIWQYASVIRGAVIGEDCSIASCSIVDGSEIGHRTIVSHGAFIDPGMVIGNDVFIGPHVIFCNDCWPRAHKDGFDMEALIKGEFVTTRVEDGASIGARAIILPGRRIGAEAMIGAGAVVTCDVPDNHVYHRDGRLVPIDPKKRQTRMRAAV